MTHYDLAIIGSGSGNTLITPEWDGKKIAIIEGGTFGGTCLNVGCIPTKMFVYPAELARAATDAGRLGVDVQLTGVRWEALRDRIFTRIDSISEAGRTYRGAELEDVDLYEEEVRFTGDRTLKTASGEVISADQVVIAAGSRAVVPDIPGLDLPQVHTSDTVMRLTEQPRRMLIIGGGYIAAEFAHIFSSLGTDVTLAVRSEFMLRSLDDTVSEQFTESARAQWKLLTGHQVSRVSSNGDGSVTADLAGPDGTALQVEADVVLVATGRKPNSDRTGAAEVGFDLAEDGRVEVDVFQRVLRRGQPVEGVWALGDVSSPFQLKHVANHEARVVTHNLLHPDALHASDHRYVPAAVFTRPQIATVGLTEEQALERAERTGSKALVAVQQYGSTAYGWAMEDTTGFVKLIAEEDTGTILGAHIMGQDASNLIQPVIQAMHFGLDAFTMARGQYWIHPALTEVVENALLSLKTPSTGG
ncbi:mycothione reductase [Arthrobacter pigmenti]|uniref:Mycothione reductase n=1 Tax=Arthrobacter pigmenti TaxID=271432 RepID=A0A846RG28_9MICC|nr:mycothione reductase [Arthrobacter pigmenti]NJC22063.1 mycothione reductase [Arthrobacter pigmenti]